MIQLLEDGTLLRIFIGESDKYDGSPLYEKIVQKAREIKIAGATVTRGIMGFGADSHMHSAKILRISEDLPVVIELVDTRENLEKLIPFLDKSVQEGLITMEDVRVIKYRHNGSEK